MSARDEILARVRANLNDAKRVDADTPEAERTPVGVPQVPAEREPRVQLFRAQLEAVGGRVHLAASQEEAAEILAGIVAREGSRRVLPSNADLARQLAAGLADVELLAPESPRAEGLTADLGLTCAQLAIAETGTLVLCSDDERSRHASLLPAVHVALLSADSIVGTLDDALQSIARDDPDEQSRAVTFITGPSRTADIELTLVVGVHGPRELDVIVLL